MDDELLDLVDDRDAVIGTILRSQYDVLVSEKLGNIRAVEMFIMNDEGQIWIPTRTADKRISPNGLDYSMAGHVDSGETYIEAALRETKEELNITLSEADLTFITKFSPGTIPYFRCLYLYKSTDTPNFNVNDFVSAEWLHPNELLARIDSGTPAKITLRETLVGLMEKLS